MLVDVLEASEQRYDFTNKVWALRDKIVRFQKAIRSHYMRRNLRTLFIKRVALREISDLSCAYTYQSLFPGRNLGYVMAIAKGLKSRLSLSEGKLEDKISDQIKKYLERIYIAGMCRYYLTTWVHAN